MKMGKKICLSLFAMVASLLLVNSVNAANEVYKISIDEDGKLSSAKGGAELVKQQDQDGKYDIDNGTITYDSSTGKMVIHEGTIISEITSKKDLTITTNNKEAIINRIYVSNVKGKEPALKIIDSKLSWDESIKSKVDIYAGDFFLIKNSTINTSEIELQANSGDLFVENSTVNAKKLYSIAGALKIEESKVKTTTISGNNSLSELDGGASYEWKNPNQYIFKENNGVAFYQILIVNSEITLVGDGNTSGISSYRGILIQGSTIKELKTGDIFETINCTGAIIENNNIWELTIKDSTVDVISKMRIGRGVNVVIENSTYTSPSNIGLMEGNLTIKGSNVKVKYVPGSKLYPEDPRYVESAITVNGDINIEDSRVTADASESNGQIVAIAYSGSIDLGNSMVAIDRKGNKLVKDIEITGIGYNLDQLKEAKNVYTIGLKNTTGNGNNNGTGSGSNSGTGSDLVDIGEVVEVTVSIEGGTWSDGTTEDKVINKMVGDTITEKDLPSGMKSNDGSTNGRWDVKLPLTLSKDTKLTYVFSVSNPETYDGVITFLVIGLVSLVSLITVFCLRKKVQ